MYFSYHNKAKKLIKGGHLIRYEFVPHYNNVSPALVLYFHNNIPMPIREFRWETYKDLIKEYYPLMDNSIEINK